MARIWHGHRNLPSCRTHVPLPSCGCIGPITPASKGVTPMIRPLPRRVLAGLLGLASALLLLAVAARPAAADDFSAYTLPGDAVYPEGVAYQAATGDYFT